MRAWRRTIVLLTAALGCLVLTLGLAFVAWREVSTWRTANRGVESGLAAQQPALEAPRSGIVVALEQYADEAKLRGALETVSRLGYGTVVQRLAWAELEPERGAYRWGDWEHRFGLAAEYGLQVVVIVDRAPAWARAPYEADNLWAPPVDPADYARLMGALATQLGGNIRGYQIWDQPNIHPHWGGGAIDPAGYVELLRQSAAALRSADPTAAVIAGGLAPNSERSGRNMSDLQFLREIYRLGAAPYWDVLGVKTLGFWTDADDRRADPDVLNFSRVILLRTEMLRRGDAAKPVWSLGGGWVALPPDWQGEPSPTGSDTAATQAARLQAAWQRVQREWPWMTLFCTLELQPAARAEDPVWGLSLLDRLGAPQPLLQALLPGLEQGSVYSPGRHLVSGRVELVEQEGSSSLPVTYYGNELWAEFEAGTAGQLTVVADRDRVVTLTPDTDGTVSVRLVATSAVGERTVTLLGSPEQLAALRALRVGARRGWVRPWLTAAMALLAGAVAALGALRCLGQVDWRWPYRRALALLARAGERPILPVLTVLLCLAMLAPNALMRLALLALYGLGAVLRPDVALVVAVASIPLAPLQVGLGPGRFSITELAVLCAVLARAGAALFETASLRQALRGWSWRRLRWTDVLLAAFVLWAALGAWRAEYQREAWREWRTCVIEPALLYLLLRTAHDGRRRWLELVRALFASSVGVALYALAIYPLSRGAVIAEGVRRARGFFGSPNNLALYLERMLPLGLSAAVESTAEVSRGRQRWAWAIGSLVLLFAIVLSFSRGAWLLGVPAGLLVLSLLRGGRVRRGVLVVLVLLALAMIPLMRTERFSSLLDLSGGTTFLRLQLWQSSWAMIRDHIWTGVGLDNFLYYYGDYILPGAEIERWLSHPHNIILDLWVRTGLVGLLLYAGAVLAALARARRAWSGLSADVRVMAVGLLGGLAALFAHGLIDNAIFVPELGHWIVFALAYLVSAAGWKEQA
ncbi:MAG: O-antigen ligase family protein [Anaerolineae bacterium]|jgi:O-antigen ligase|nr:O-antigen ligase family protein [Chloroflexota bacterium]